MVNSSKDDTLFCPGCLLHELPFHCTIYSSSSTSSASMDTASGVARHGPSGARPDQMSSCLGRAIAIAIALPRHEDFK